MSDINRLADLDEFIARLNRTDTTASIRILGKFIYAFRMIIQTSIHCVIISFSASGTKKVKNSLMNGILDAIGRNPCSASLGLDIVIQNENLKSLLARIQIVSEPADPLT